MSRIDLWEKLWGTYIAKLQRIDELKKAGRYGYQLRMPYKSLQQAEKALLKEFPEASEYVNPSPKSEMGLHGNGSKYDRILSVFRLLSEETLKRGRKEFSYSDFSPASFAMQDIQDVDYDGQALSVFLKDGRSWKGDPRELKATEENILSNWVEVRAVESNLGSPQMGLHTQEEQIQAVDMAADALSRGHDAAASNNLFGLATEIGYLRALTDLATSEGAPALATIARQNADTLVSRFRKLYEEIG